MRVTVDRPPADEEEDYAYDVWAGVLPITTSVGEPEADPFTAEDVDRPAYLFDRRIG